VKRTRRKLALGATTIRILSTIELAPAAGGATQGAAGFGGSCTPTEGGVAGFGGMCGSAPRSGGVNGFGGSAPSSGGVAGFGGSCTM
jgi:hypothetical protein